MMKFVLLMLYALVCDGKIIQPLMDKRSILFNETVPANSFGQSGFGGSWVGANEFTYYSAGNLMKYDVIANSSIELIKSGFGSRFGNSSSLSLSPDGSKVLIRYSPRQIFRHSTVARYAVAYMNDLSVSFKVNNGEEVQVCVFTPNSNGILYIKDNTMYYATDMQMRQEVSERISAIGQPGVIYHGIPDWVYEEEVLGSATAAWFSPDGKYVAYASFDDTNVRDFMYELYGDGKGEYQYPKEVHLRYPKVGERNPIVTLSIEDLSIGGINPIVLPAPDEVKVGNLYGEEDHVLGIVFWTSNTRVGAIWMNRRQNKGIFAAYNQDINGWTYEKLMEIDEPRGWIELNTPKCDSNGICFFINNANNWPSLVSIDTNTREYKVLSKNKHVFSYYGAKDGKLYFLATPGKDEPQNRFTYTYDLNTGDETCVTCGILTPEQNECTYATTAFSTDLSHYALTCSGPDPSFTNIYNTNTNTIRLNWQTNDALRTKLRDYDLPQVKYLHVPVAGGFNAMVKMLIPPEIDLDNVNNVVAKYPLLVRVYGGPGSVRVSSAFGIGYQSYQVTTKKIVYVEIDGRGTNQKGVDMMFSVNNRLGTFEMQDQISVTKKLLSQFKFIDPSRVSIWGWSYGGYATAMTLAQDSDLVFKCGISVAPVTSWIFYDTIYTERYMGFNAYAKHYNDSDVSSPYYVKQIGKHDFFLIHGNADDNVHYQQSMVLAGALERADIMFEQMSYPDEAHGLTYVQLHLYHTLDRFWNKCFNL